MKRFQVEVIWPWLKTSETVTDEAEDSQQFLNKVRAEILKRTNYGADFRFGKVIEICTDP